MKVLSVQAFDFLLLGEVRAELSDQGLCLLQGENSDNPSAVSNGSGKSSLVDALCWGLFGETARGVEAGGVIRSGAKKAAVRVELEDEDGTLYAVERERTKTKLSLAFKSWRPPAEPEDLTLGTAALTQARIERVLGCGLEVFRSAVYVGQERMPDLPGLPDKKLKELIEEAAGLSVLEAAYARARELCQEAERAAKDATAKREAAEALHARLLAEVDDIQHRSHDWERDRLTRSERHHDAALRLLNERDAMAASAAFKVDPAPVEAALRDVEAKLTGFAAEQVEEKRLVVALTMAERRESEAAATSRLQCDAADRADAAAAEMTAPGATLVCRECGQPVGDGAHAHAFARMASRVSERRGAAEEARKAHAAAQEAAQGAREALAGHRAGMGDPSALNERAGKLRRVLEAHREAKRRHDDLGAAVRQEVERRDAAKSEPNPLDPLLAAKRDERDTAEEQAKLARAAEVARGEELATHQLAVKVFGPAGVRAQVLDQVTPYLNDRTAAYLGTLSDGTMQANWTTLVKDAKGVLKERFCIEVTHPAGEGFAGLSGGEKRKVRIACALALQDLVASRATKPIRLWAVDEADDALDEAGLERFVAVLHEKAKEKGTVLVISHRDLKLWIRNVWTMKRSGGKAALEVA